MTLAGIAIDPARLCAKKAVPPAASSRVHAWFSALQLVCDKPRGVSMSKPNRRPMHLDC
jgi:hypothetical protein